MQKTILNLSVIALLLITFQTHSHAWPIPHSGQTKCYDNEYNNEIPCPKPGEPFYGQSGNYNINPKSFTKLDDHGNDLPDDAEDWLMVRDNVTGLIWEVKQSSTSHANYTGYAWGIHFYHGYDNYLAKGSSYYVRAVRGGQCRSFGHLIIWSPMQAEILITGTTLPITWDTSTIEGNVTITLSRQGGKSDTFETIISETANDGHYEWTITGPPSPNCMLKIEPVSFPYSGTQQSFFTNKNPDMKINTNVQSQFSISGPERFTGTGSSRTIENALPGTYTITYDPLTCWQTPANECQSLTYWGTLNFSGIYGQKVNGLKEVFDSIDESYSIVQNYDVHGALTFDLSAPSFFNTLHYIGPGYGYWI
jgi:hypothetical protein